MVSGFRVSWDSRRPAGQRVLGVWLVEEPSASRALTPYHSGTTTPAATSATSLAVQDQRQTQTPPELHDLEEVKRVKGGRKYRLVTREYMAQGHDGFEAFKGAKYLVDDESGELMSTIVRKYLLGECLFAIVGASLILYICVLGSRFVNRMSRMQPQQRIETLLNSATKGVIEREQARQQRYNRSAKIDIVSKWKHALQLAVRYSRAHYKDLIHVTSKEHMSGVDCFDGSQARTGTGPAQVGDEAGDSNDQSEEDLVLIHPVIDGRLKDQGRS